MRITTRWIIVIGLMRAAVGCDPQTIAPLPSPFTPPPDGTNILLSSLTAEEHADRLVAIVGFDKAVAGQGDVKIVNTRTGAGLQYASTKSGTFAAAFEAQAGDALAVSFVREGVESESIEVTVPSVVEQKTSTNSPPPRAGADPDGDDFEGTPAAPQTDAATEVRVLPVIVSQGDGTVTITSDNGFIDPQTWLVIANLTLGTVNNTLSDSNGRINDTFPGYPGDEIAFFSQSAEHPELTSPVVKTQIPAK